MSMSYVERHIRYNNTTSLDIPEWYITKIEKEPYLERQQYDLAWQHAQQAAHLGAPVQALLEALRRVREQAR